MHVRCVQDAKYTLLFSHGNAVDLGQMSSFFIGLGKLFLLLNIFTLMFFIILLGRYALSTFEFMDNVNKILLLFRLMLRNFYYLVLLPKVSMSCCFLSSIL